MSVTTLSPAASGAAAGPLTGGRLLAAAILIGLGNFLVVLDTTIANVSVRTIAGNLGVSSSQGTWVIVHDFPQRGAVPGVLDEQIVGLREREQPLDEQLAPFGRVPPIRQGLHSHRLDGGKGVLHPVIELIEQQLLPGFMLAHPRHGLSHLKFAALALGDVDHGADQPLGSKVSTPEPSTSSAPAA